MIDKTGKQAGTQAVDSDPLEESRELPPVSTLPSRTRKPAARKPCPEPMDTFGGHNLLLDLPPELRIIVYEYCVATNGPVTKGAADTVYTWNTKKSPMPSLLSVNRQIREEALAVYYKTNEFRFKKCHAQYITRWLFRAVQPQHLKFVGAISWISGHKMQASFSGPKGDQRIRSHNHVDIWAKSTQDQAIHLSSVIMLLELGLLGSCKVKMALDNEPRLHVACKLRELTKKIVARKKVTEADAWNEDGVPGEDDVAGLAYAVAKEWGRIAPRAFGTFQNQGSSLALTLAPEMYCSSCQTVNTSPRLGWTREDAFSRLPWVSQIDGAETESDHMQLEKASGTKANRRV